MILNINILEIIKIDLLWAMHIRIAEATKAIPKELTEVHRLPILSLEKRPNRYAGSSTAD